MAGHIRTRGATTVSKRVRRQRRPNTSRSIHAQVCQMPRCERTQSSTARTHVPTTVSVCMFRRSEAYIDAHGVLGGLIQYQSLQQAVALDFKRYDVLLVTSVNPTSSGSATAARAQETRPVGSTPAAHCTVCRAGCARAFHCVHTRLRVRVSTFARMLGCVMGVGSGHGAVRVQLRDRLFGGHGPKVASSCSCLI